MTRWLFLATLLLTAGPAVAGPYDSLLKVVPSTANTLVLIDSEAIFKSPLGQSLKWYETFAQRFRAGGTTIPSDSKKIVIAGNTNARTFQRQWQVALGQMKQVPNAREVASREGGSVDEVAGRFAALSPRDVYFVTLSEQETATWYPANRQLLAHWLRNVKATADRKDLPLSPYLQEVAKGDAEGAQLVASMDLADAYDLAGVRGWLEGTRTLVTRPDVTVEPVAKMIAQMRGLTLAVGVTDKLTATLRVDFNLDTATHKTVLKDLFTEALEDEGLSLGDIAWETTYKGKSMILKGDLEPSAMGRILSLFEFPQEEDGSTAAKPGDKPNADATKRYFKAVVATVDEVRNLQDKKDYEKTATWHESYARKINQISTRGVDPAAVAFATGAAERLRAIAGSLRGVPIDAKALASGAYALASVSTYGRGFGWRGGRDYNLDTNIPQTKAAIAKVVAQDEKTRLQIWSEIQNSTVSTRQKLNDAYGGGF